MSAKFREEINREPPEVKGLGMNFPQTRRDSGPIGAGQGARGKGQGAGGKGQGAGGRAGRNIVTGGPAVKVFGKGDSPLYFEFYLYFSICYFTSSYNYLILNDNP